MALEPIGRKDDAGKPMMELLDSEWLEGVAQVLTFGAKKYSAHNWRGGLKYSRLLGGLLRHIFSFLRGEDKDPETGLSHLLHASCCLMFLYWHTLHRPELDDRYKNNGQSTTSNVAGAIIPRGVRIGSP